MTCVDIESLTFSDFILSPSVYLVGARQHGNWRSRVREKRDRLPKLVMDISLYRVAAGDSSIWVRQRLFVAKE